MVTKEELDQYIVAYSKGQPLISDEEYDVLLEEYVKAHGEASRPFTRQKQSSNVNDVVGTLTKTFGVTAPMRPGLPVYTDWLRKKIIPSKTKICVQPKFDGCSVAWDVLQDRYFTRGDYDNGESVDVTALIQPYRHTHPSKNDSEKFECIMSRDVYYALDLNNKYKRPRDAVSGSMTSRSPLEFATLAPLRDYRDGRQYIPPTLEEMSMMTTAEDLDGIQGFIDNLLSDGAVVKYDPHGNGTMESFECDGVVVSVINADGSTGEECAIKILNMVQQTRLVRVNYQFGKTGRITPVAIVEPVKFGNIAVDHITLSTLGRILDLNLKLNDTVSIMYNIVPYLMSSNHDGDTPVSSTMPTTCPACGKDLDMTSLKLVRCTNPECVGKKVGSMIRYCKTMKMFGVSEKTVGRLYDEGLLKSISDLYRLKVEDIEPLEGYGKQSAENIVNAIRMASTDIPMSRWLGAFPMNDIATKTWTTVLGMLYHKIPHMETDSMNDVILNNMFYNEQSPRKLCHAISKLSIGDITCMRIQTGVAVNWNEMIAILPFIQFHTEKPKTQSTKGRVSMTGTRDAELTSFLEKKGYEVADFSPNKTIALVIPNDAFTSNKVTKAKSIGIPVHTIEEAYRVL